MILLRKTLTVVLIITVVSIVVVSDRSKKTFIELILTVKGSRELR